MATNKKQALVEAGRDNPQTISDASAEAAVRQLIEWIGEDPTREGLHETPQRFIKAWKEFFKGYKEDPKKHLKKTFAEVGGYQGPITLQNIHMETYCEHHLVPFVGEAFISYIPNRKVVGLSKLVRLLDGYSKRMQVQERLTAQIAQAIYEELEPKGVAVAIRSEHFCMTTRGVHRPGAQMLTAMWLGDFETKEALRSDFMKIVNSTRFSAS
ncbi:MAG: GTP cyclohydrolase I FolE [Alphaproteobacteria bacterium]